MTDTFESILDGIGSFGIYQIAIWVFINLGDFSTSLTMLLPVFVSAKPSWMCPVVGNDTLLYDITPAPIVGYPSTMAAYTNSPHSNTSNMTLVPNVCTADNGVCPGIVYSKDFTSIVSEWDLICAWSYIPDRVVTTVQMVGVWAGAVFISMLADLFGRKKIWFACILINAVVGVGSVFVNSWQLFAVTRFFAGMCVGGLLVINFMYPLEFIGPAWRPFAAVVGLWCFGIMLLSLLAFYIRQWCYLVLATAVPQTILLFGWWFLPESPRWLAMHHRIEESEQVLFRIAHFNKKTKPDISTLKKFVEEEDKKSTKSRRYTYKDLFRTPDMTKNCFILMYTWLVCAGVYYGISFNVKNLTGDRYINNFLFGLIELPVVCSSVFFNKWSGRKWTLFGFMITGGASLLAIFIVDATGHFESYGGLVNALAIFGRCALSSGWSVATLYVTELFPTVVRSTALGASNFSGRLGGVIAPLIVSLSETSKLLPYIIFGFLAITSAILGLLLPETSGKPLPDNVPEWSWGQKKTEKTSKENPAFICHETGL